MNISEKTIELQDVASWLKLQKSAVVDMNVAIILQLLEGETTIEELREWILEAKAKGNL